MRNCGHLFHVTTKTHNASKRPKSGHFTSAAIKEKRAQWSNDDDVSNKVSWLSCLLINVWSLGRQCSVTLALLLQAMINGQEKWRDYENEADEGCICQSHQTWEKHLAYHSGWQAALGAHIVWKWRFWILAFSTNFCPIKTDLSGNSVWPKASGFQKFAKMDHFLAFLINFCPLKM